MFVRAAAAALAVAFSARADAPGAPAARPHITLAPRPAATPAAAVTTGPILRPRVPASPKAIEGFADFHLHQVAELGFGGRYIWGGHDGDPKQVLRHCSGMGIDHGLMSGAEGGSGNLHPHSAGGFPDFGGWPRWNSTSHQQAHADWLKHAHEQGLKLVVVSALNQDLFCEMIPLHLRNAKMPCDDFQAVVRQLEATHEFAKRHDWYVIVKSPAEARAVIEKGKLAVVLAVEAGNVLGEGKDWKARLEKLHALGVRSLQPVHEVDNRFSGASWHADAIKALQTVENFTHIEKHVDAFVNNVVATFNKNINHPDRIPAAELAATKKFASGMFGFTLDKHKLNAKGLSHEGEQLLAEMMGKQMIVDVSHMSQKALRQAHEVSGKHGHYPLFMSHAHIKELLAPEEITEWSYPSELFDLVAETGGVIGLRSSPDEMRNVHGSPVQNDCHGSTKSFAQIVYYAEKLLGLQIGYATDFNGWAKNLMPRFGARGETCAGSGYDAESIVQMARQHGPSGSSLDKKGFAHIGLIGDLDKELTRLGAPTDGLHRSAESFVKMWERGLDAHRPALPKRNSAHAAVAQVAPYEKNGAKKIAALAKAPAK